jgi:hypothetical protein
MNRPFFLLVFVIGTAAPISIWADAPGLPGAGFNASRYDTLWTKSPFAVASADASAPASSDYSLVGIAQFEGISYASLIEKQSQEHFLISGEKPTRGFTLVSVTRGKEDGTDTFAVVQKDGQSITLRLESAPPSGAVAASVSTPQIPMPGAAVPSHPGAISRPPPGTPPPILFRRRIIRIPPGPDQNQSGVQIMNFQENPPAGATNPAQNQPHPAQPQPSQ